MNKEYEKFSINLETDEGLKELLSYLRKQDLEFASEDETRIVRRLRLYTRRLGLKNYSELMIRLKNDEKLFKEVIQWLESGRTYNRDKKTYSPLIKKRGITKRLSSYSSTEKRKKSRDSEPKSLIPPLMIKDSPKDVKNLPLILDFLSSKNINYQAYKQNYFFRRLHARMNKAKTQNYVDYLNLLKMDSNEVNLLLASFSINVTRFFRDKELFLSLEKEILVSLFKERNNPVRIWSAGCCTGPEPYSLAILIRNLQEKENIRNFYLLATDISLKFLHEAKEGIFSSDFLKEVDKATIQKFFSPTDTGEFRLVPEIRQMVTFQQHDLRTAPPANNFDLIMCRNVLIYFSRAQSDEFFKRFLSVLKPNGYLILGKCEILPQTIKDNFIVMDTRNRIYKRKNVI
ncbi:MAG: CheR family methyltransferase [Candidatus Hodarchaeales archaeon]|jgi:chemotaxis protein methyltransferase CheR